MVIPPWEHHTSVATLRVMKELLKFTSVMVILFHFKRKCNITLYLYEGKEEDYIIGIEFYTYRRSCGIRRSSDTSSNRIVSYRCCEKYYRLNYLTGSLNSEGLITGVELHWIRD